MEVSGQLHTPAALPQEKELLVQFRLVIFYLLEIYTRPYFQQDGNTYLYNCSVPDASNKMKISRQFVTLPSHFKLHCSY
jgi:hypothetical protein